MAKKTLKLISYNSTGLACDKCEFITDIIDKYKPSILLLQEKWLINSKLNVLNNIYQYYLAKVILAGDFNVDFSNNNVHDVYCKVFSIRIDFVYTFDMPNAETGYTYHDPANNSYSR